MSVMHLDTKHEMINKKKSCMRYSNNIDIMILKKKIINKRLLKPWLQDDKHLGGPNVSHTEEKKENWNCFLSFLMKIKSLFFT